MAGVRCRRRVVSLVRRLGLAALLAAAGSIAACCPAGQTQCGMSCCKEGFSCCEDDKSCCPHDKPHLCRVSGQCYRFFTDAQRDCGNSYLICGGPVGALPRGEALAAWTGAPDDLVAPAQTCSVGVKPASP